MNFKFAPGDLVANKHPGDSASVWTDGGSDTAEEVGFLEDKETAVVIAVREFCDGDTGPKHEDLLLLTPHGICSWTYAQFIKRVL